MSAASDAARCRREGCPNTPRPRPGDTDAGIQDIAQRSSCPLGERLCGLQVRVGQRYAEFVAAEASHHGFSTSGLDEVGKCRAHPAQQVIACRVTVAVIHSLEAIQVTHQHRDRRCCTVDVGKTQIECSTVRYPGQRIFEGVRPHGTEQFRTPEGDCGLRGDGLQHLGVPVIESAALGPRRPEFPPHGVTAHHG